MRIAKDYNTAYTAHLSGLRQRYSEDQAFRRAIGGEFSAIGQLEHHLLRSLGLSDGHLVVDVGCGSGRLACQLAVDPQIHYMGCDILPDLLDYARELSDRPDWTFIPTQGTVIPCESEQADFVCFFSVFTHLIYQDTFRYFREAARCLRKDGYLVFSFLEFRMGFHWATFIGSVDRQDHEGHLDQFIEREAIRAWARHSGFEIIQLCDGDQPHIPIPHDIVFENGQTMSGLGNMGQSVAVLRKL